MILPEKGFKRTAVITFYISIAVICTYLFFKYALKCVLPFVIAYAVSVILRKPVLYLRSKYKFGIKFSAFAVTTLFFALIFTLIYLLVYQTAKELSGLSKLLTEDRITSFVSNLAEGITNLGFRYFPHLSSKIEPYLLGTVNNLDEILKSAASYIIPFTASTLMDFFGALPSFFLFFGVTLLASYYFSIDYEKIRNFILLQLNDRQKKFVSELKNQFFGTVFCIIRAYAVLISITFAELLAGFLVIGIEYATILAVLIAIIDLLPVLGTGTILFPMSIIYFFTGNSKTGLCILALYVIITVIRQIAEPKILGNSSGLHPIATLASMYFGAKLAGITGLFIFPLILIIIKNLNEKGFISLYKNHINIHTTNKEKKK